MKAPLHILHLEDNANDSILAAANLEAAGIDCAITLVQDRGGFVAALEAGGIDLVLSDFTLPVFHGKYALAMLVERWPDIPVILLSGTVGEEFAIDSLKSGATDYVLKHHLSRLAPAVRRAMLEVDARSERRRLELQVIEAQKMEVIGQLAGGVAHDFANILGVIIGYTDLIIADLDPNNPVQKYAEEIRNASDRAVGLTRQLLVVSSRETVQPIVLNLNETVKDLDRMLRRLVDENIEITIEASADLHRVKADPGYVGQVLMNLVVNARDAMPEGGMLSVKTSNVTCECRIAEATPPIDPGTYVVLSVSDTGTGMTPEVKKRLFEAFFTTKEKGKGTGLGLATCRTIVQQSGGHIRVQSEAGQGATFEIYLPAVELPLSALVSRAAPGLLPRGTETLLVVEDEPSVRHLARDVLAGQGYEVLSASNGQDGLHVARDHHGAPIRLVVTDVIMPLMGGKVMAEWLKSTYPGLKVLFTSGYSDETITRHGVLDPDVEFLPKPYTPSGLTRKVRELLDKTLQPV